jgi:hypothetical protein
MQRSHKIKSTRRLRAALSALGSSIGAPAASNAHTAAASGHTSVVDRLLLDARVLQTADDDLFASLTRISMVRSRFTVVCIGLHGLDLPALTTLEILDALVPNSIRMALKWDLIVAVRQFCSK